MAYDVREDRDFDKAKSGVANTHYWGELMSDASLLSLTTAIGSAALLTAEQMGKLDLPPSIRYVAGGASMLGGVVAIALDVGSRRAHKHADIDQVDIVNQRNAGYLKNVVESAASKNETVAAVAGYEAGRTNKWADAVTTGDLAPGQDTSPSV